MKKLQIFGTLILFIGLALAWIFYDWKLVLILFLVLWGNNGELVSKLNK